MKMLMILYSGPDPQRVAHVLEERHAPGWTQLAHARGAGATGRRDATRAWPGESTVFITVLPTEDADALSAALRAFGASADGSERLHVAVLPVERFC